MCPHPVRMIILTFNYGPYVQAFQPQPNNKNARRIDEATHQIVQRYLPPSVKAQYDTAHTSGAVISANKFINGFCFVVETRLNGCHWVARCYYWHPSFGTGCITSSWFMLQPNIQEHEFGS